MLSRYNMYEMEITVFADYDEFAGCWDGSIYDGGKTDQESIKNPTSDM